MGVSSGYDGLRVAVSESLGKSLTDEVLVQGRVDGHLEDTRRGGGLGEGGVSVSILYSFETMRKSDVAFARASVILT